MKPRNPLSRKENIVVQEMEGEVLVYDLSENKAVCLNETSALVWQACDGNRTPAEISEFISKKLNTTANEDLIWLALDQLKKENLIENSEDLPNHFAGMSRREAIKKVGLSSLIALPVIMAVTSPVAAAAGSFCGATLNAACRCTLGFGGVIPPGGPATFTGGGSMGGTGQYCDDVTATCMGAAPGASPCVCFVPNGTVQSGDGLFAGTCQENV